MRWCITPTTRGTTEKTVSMGRRSLDKGKKGDEEEDVLAHRGTI